MLVKKLSIAVAAFCLSTGAALAQDATAPNANADHGKQRFMADGCWQCHGVSANGAALTGPKLSRTELAFDAFIHQLRHPSSEMPPYEVSIVSDSDAADIYAFLKSLPDSPKAKDVPLIMNMGVK
jgi:mono/diheme cytochrome c family protein